MIWIERLTLDGFVGYLQGIARYRPIVDAACKLEASTCAGQPVTRYATVSAELAPSYLGGESLAFRFVKPENSQTYSPDTDYLSYWLHAYDFSRRRNLLLSPIELESLASELSVRDFFSPRYSR